MAFRSRACLPNAGLANAGLANAGLANACLANAAIAGTRFASICLNCYDRNSKNSEIDCTGPTPASAQAFSERETKTQMTDASTESLVLLDFDDHGDAGRVARVTFNNPEKRNALGLAGKDRFIEVMTSLRHDETLRAVVVTGAGERSFVGGTNLAEMAEFDLAAAEASATRTHRVCDAVRQMPVPVIARINGYCFGSGMEIAACADMRVAADHAKFGMPEVRHGIPSGMEASVLPRLIGWGKACELVLTGDHIEAEEAYRIGFLERLVPMAELDGAVESWLASILAAGPRAVRIQKRLILDWDRMSVTDGARAGIQAYVDAYRTDEPRRLMTAFMNRKRR